MTPPSPAAFGPGAIRRSPGVERCPCGGGAYVECCEPLHAGRRQADTAEGLMRSRYSAFALGLGDYLFRTWHPRTRPSRVDADGPRWFGLDIIDIVDGQPGDDVGVVEFVAHHEGGQLRERSRFERRAGRWFYVDGEITES